MPLSMAGIYKSTSSFGQYSPKALDGVDKFRGVARTTQRFSRMIGI
jgi:hypothetical protein